MNKPTYYYFRFRTALLCILLMFVIAAASHFKTIEFRDKYEYMISQNVKLSNQLRQCNADVDMTIDLYTSNGNASIMSFYCDRWAKFNRDRIERAN